jgi:hypothetical protein
MASTAIAQAIIHRDVFFEIVGSGLASTIPNPHRLIFDAPIRNIIRIDLICFGAYGFYNNELSYLALSSDELSPGSLWLTNRGADLAAVAHIMPNPNLLAMIPIQGEAFNGHRISYGYNPAAPLGQVLAAIPRLDTMTLRLLTNLGLPDTRTLKYWACLRFICTVPPEQLTTEHLR